MCSIRGLLSLPTLPQPFGWVGCGGESASLSFPFSLPIVASMMSHAGGSSVCCVCVRARARPPRRAGRAAVDQGRGAVGRRPSQVDRPLKVKSHSRFVRPRVFGFSERMGQDISPRAPPVFWVQSRVRWWTVQVMPENVLCAGPAAREERAQDLERQGHRCHHQHNAIQECLLCPHRVLPTVLQATGLTCCCSKEHSLHLHFSQGLADHIGGGEKTLTVMSSTFSEVSHPERTVKPQG